MTWHIAMRKGLRKKLDLGTQLGLLKEKYEQTKASMRAKVEHPFRVIKEQFGFNKVLPGHRQERQQAADDVCAGKSVAGARSVEASAGMSAPAGAQNGQIAVNAA